MTLSDSFRRIAAPGSSRTAIQLTSGRATNYPLYYFIPSLSGDSQTLVFHRADPGRDGERGDVQIHALDLATGEEWQLTHGDTPDTHWMPWCIDSGTGVLDHRSVLNTTTNELIYFNGNDVRACSVHRERGADRSLFELPDDRLAIGQNCVTPDGQWFVYIHHDRESYPSIYPDGHFQPDRCGSRGTVLAAFHLTTGEHRALVTINSPIHHVYPLAEGRLLFCHPATENGMLLTDLRGGWYSHLRTQDERGGTVCHYLATERGIAYEVLGGSTGVLSGLYNPDTHENVEWKLPGSFGYTHTGFDPEGLLWFYENSSRETHDLRLMTRLRADGTSEWTSLTGNWPTYGGGQKSHFHPQVLPGRDWILMTAGDPATESNHLYLLDISDLDTTEGVPTP